MEAQKRVKFIDIARGIAIILMLVGHTIPEEHILSKIIFSFHMPLFVITSGFFFKEDEKISKVMKNIVLKFILPAYIFWGISQFILISMLNILPSWQYRAIYVLIQIWDNKFQMIGVLWFLPFLGMIRILFLAIYKLANKKDNIVGIVTGICFVIGYTMKILNIQLPFYIDNALTCLFVYQIGYLLNKKNIFAWLSNHKWMYIVLILTWLGICIAQENRLDIAHDEYGILGIGLLGANCGTIVMFKISKGLEKVPKVGDFLALCGKNSIIILIVHQIEWETFLRNGLMKRLISPLEHICIRVGLDVTAGIVYGAIKEKILQMRKIKEGKKKEKQKKEIIMEVKI